ncbi:nucleotidyltransferase family protein [Propionibacteriaceae bacterium G1746]|uniref:nucleotidyltransferase family protein n=1 Tax=Aestuariimicrobium sp. G57 TaxID=3418485 RepID=UPI003C1F50B5
MRSHALVLAAGAGRRMGMPKALVPGTDGEPWVARTVRVLREGGCTAVTVVAGAAADQVAPLARAAGAGVVVADDWDQGMGASMAAGMAAVADGGVAGDLAADVLVLMLVDLPDIGPSVVARVLAAVEDRTNAREVVVRAAYAGVPGHPVVVGRAHWDDLAATLHGDRGARDWLAAREVALVECGDLAGGQDVDVKDG